MPTSLESLTRKLQDFASIAECEVANHFKLVEDIALFNQNKVLSAFNMLRISESHFLVSSGYGYSDIGRDAIDSLFSVIFGTESSIVRPSFVSGTHALSTVLFALLKPGDTLFSITGKPYDTMHKVIGIEGSDMGSLKEIGVNFEYCDFLPDGSVDISMVKDMLIKDPSISIVYIQRSSGYSWRKSLTIGKIQTLITELKSIRNDIIVFVDNCYGEFTEKLEPTQVGADIIAGSLIKNPGGGIAKSGGYISGSHKLIEKCAYRMTAPGLGIGCGSNMGANREILQGIFNAPYVTSSALKTAIFAASLFRLMGYEVMPESDDLRSDIIQAIKFKDVNKLIRFCQEIQKASPVDSYVLPEPWSMPGYSEKVIMASGSFTQGSSIELSADAPIREPYIGYLQGSLNEYHGRIALLRVAKELLT